MPRQSRKLSESKNYHVMIRGNEKKELFRNNEDKARFIAILKEKNEHNKYSIYAFCLMDNHVHLLINEGRDEISRIMKRINVSYVYYFNKKYNRTGHLFQDRFKSEIIETDSYLLAAARYIHRNPLKAGITQKISQYRWSSYPAYIHENDLMKNIVDTDMILGILSPDRQTAVQMFIEYTSQDTKDDFLEYQENDEKEKDIINEKNARIFINEYLRKKDLVLNDLKNKNNINHRDELICALKMRSNLSIRQLAEILNLDRNIIQRRK
ncbi:transposase [Candidatus Formimonas warabiya]|uniref:Transposase n=1 Tax=Formimonas warabiya TaxID=1761012 RepID=A0A3G1KVH7_FORW1|nr:transposase [Candidatus Formimonas warabiya]ATW26523.1 transposase [Candidatus Formimonas warabiya]